MPTVLSIVETAYRATVEEQDDPILWLNHMLHTNGLDVAILLRSNAVNYAVAGQDASGLAFGGITLDHSAVIHDDLGALIAKGVPVSYVREDLEERGISESRLIDGVKAVSKTELPGLLEGFDHVWHW